jgi:hypothetical protein
MNSGYWADTDDDGDRKRRRQAEFLVLNFFPWTLIDEIVVCDELASEQVRRHLGGPALPAVRVNRGWYY